jgi:hypothetical protein
MEVVYDVEEKEALSGGRLPITIGDWWGIITGLFTGKASLRQVSLEWSKDRKHGGVWHEQRYRLVNGELPDQYAKQRIGLLQNYKDEDKTLAIRIFYGVLASVVLVAVVAGAMRFINQRKRRGQPAVTAKPNNPTIGQSTGELLVSGYGFTPDEERLSDYNVMRDLGDHNLADDILAKETTIAQRSEGNQEVVSNKLSEFVYWYKHFAPVKPITPESLRFTIEDLRLYERVFNVMGNMRHSPAFTNFLFYIAWFMADAARAGQISFEDIGPEIKEHRLRYEDYIRTQESIQPPGGGRVTMAGKALDSYVGYDDIDDLFRTPAYVNSYLNHYYPAFANAQQASSSSLQKLPEELNPHKTYHEIAGGFLNWRGWMQVAINALPAAVY